jgi:hypothetical protein
VRVFRALLWLLLLMMSHSDCLTSLSSDVVVAVAAVQKLLPSAAFEQCTPLSWRSI